MAMRVSAAPQPRSWAPVYGCVAFEKICEGSEVLAPLEHVRVRAGHGEDGEQQRRGLARGPGDGEQRAADDPADRRGQHHGQRDAGLGGAQSVAGLAQRVRHQPQHLVAGADHDRQHQAAQGEGAGQARVAEVQHPDREDEQAHHDRGHARHHVGHEPDERREPVLAAVLVEVDGAQDAERHRHDRGQRRDLERAEYRRPHPADAGREHVGRDRAAGQELPADDRGALGDDREQDESQRDDHEHERDHHEDGHDPVLGAPPALRLAQVGCLPGYGRGGHQAPLFRRADRSTIPRARTLMMIVKTNRSTPRPISAARNSPEASPNWFAMTAGML